MKVLAVIVNPKWPELLLQGLKSLAVELGASAGGGWGGVTWALGLLSGRSPWRVPGKTGDAPRDLLSDFVRFSFPHG